MSSATTVINPILIIGAGELGLPVIKHLLLLLDQQPQGQQDAFQISVLLRPSRISALEEAAAVSSNSPKDNTSFTETSLLKHPSIHIVTGDLATASIDSLASLFTSFHTVVSCTGFAGGPGTQLKLARAALQARVKRYFPWQFGIDYDAIGRGSAQNLFDEQLDVRDLLRGQTQSQWVIVSTGMFTSFLFEPWFGVVQGEKVSDGDGVVVVRALGGWDNKVTVTTPEDIGRVTARVILDASISNTIVYSAGDTIAYGGLADVVDEVLAGGTMPVRREVWTVEQLKEDLVSEPENAIKKYRVVFAEGKGASWPKEQTVNDKGGMQLQDIKSWADQNLKQKLGV